MKQLANLPLSRREAVVLALAAGLNAAAWPPRSLAADQAALITRAVPSTGQRLPVIGIGTNSFTESKRDELRTLLERMLELGGSVIDTAPVYGEREQVIGELLADRLDLLQVHNFQGVDQLWPQLLEWKRAGRIRYIGITTATPSDHPEMIRLMRRYSVDLV